MAIKTKCQYCWKVFEVAEGFANKQRLCPFCQRTTTAVPLSDNKVSPTTDKKTAMLDTLQYPQVSIRWLLILAVALTILNLFATISLIGQRRARTSTWDNIQQEPFWKVAFEKRIDELNEKAEALEREVREHKRISASQYSGKLVSSLEGSIQFISISLAKIQEKLERAKKIFGDSQQVTFSQKDARQEPTIYALYGLFREIDDLNERIVELKNKLQQKNEK